MQKVSKKELSDSIQNEFKLLKDRFNKNAYIKTCNIICNDDTYFKKIKEAISTDRVGEVVFAVERPNGRIITITCTEYPEGTYRVPTGGIAYGEKTEEAVYREVMEELGLESRIISFLGLMVITFSYQGEETDFYSYLFHLKEIGGIVLEDATDDEVSAIKEANKQQLEDTAQKLLSLSGEWKDWGEFRSITTKAIAEYV